MVLLTNDEQQLRKGIGTKNDGWLRFHQVNMEEVDHPYHFPYFHRTVIEEYVTGKKSKEEANTTNLPPPTAYAYFESDTVVDGPGMIAWARDTAHVQHYGGLPGVDNPVRHFWRWEWNEAKQCVAMNGETNPLPRDRPEFFKQVGGRTFVHLRYGKFAGNYAVTAAHMQAFYQSGMFWTLPDDPSFSREIQLYMVVHGNNVSTNVNGKETDNTFVPIDPRTETLDLVAAAHHQSDKYTRSPWPFGKLCLDDLFFVEE